jgi:transcriptional regulator with XRE-family HTH domain
LTNGNVCDKIPYGNEVIILPNGTDLKRIRNEKNLSILELSQITGLSLGAISRYENGRRTPSVIIAMKIAKALNVPIYEIFPYNVEDNTL